jgi:hypothetical protein
MTRCAGVYNARAWAETFDSVYATAYSDGSVFYSRPGVLDVLCKFSGLVAVRHPPPAARRAACYALVATVPWAFACDVLSFNCPWAWVVCQFPYDKLKCAFEFGGWGNSGGTQGVVFKMKQDPETGELVQDAYDIQVKEATQGASYQEYKIDSCARGSLTARPRRLLPPTRLHLLLPLLAFPAEAVKHLTGFAATPPTRMLLATQPPE